ncbi:hypothetical protein CPB84DRAFT_1774726 [Gymnopilus junonius]|uniref:Uncharacterized protein n=1 Tax=Gymnopilus junonius TaxID=109634 RepID=A0A9P5TPN4_GYMJU|nr:hypothetical protein CPB84DRAFT_1774726 [Gymnopilus junonius]
MGSPKNGWFDALLEKFNEIFRSAPDVSFNQEFDPQRQTTTLVSHGVRARPSGTNLDLINEKFIKELVKTSVREETRVSNKPARTHSGDGANLTAASKSRKSSSLLMLGDAVLGSQIDPGEYTIMKIAHHGSAHNNYALPRKYGLTYVEIKVSPGVLQDAFRFFNYVKAKKFVISASPTEGSPNPHVTTILAIYLAAVELGRKVDVYMTNKLPRNALKGLMYFLFGPERATYPGANGTDEQILEKNAKLSQNLIDRLKKFDDHMKIWLLKPDVPYGSIPFNDDDPSTDFWIPITEEELRVELSPSLAKSAIAAKARAVSKRIQATVGTAAPGPSTSKKKKP